MTTPTVEDELGDELAHLALIAQQREEWTTEAAMHELYVEDIVRSPEALAPFQERTRELVREADVGPRQSKNQQLGALVTVDRLSRFLAAVELARPSDVERARAAIAAAQMESDYAAERWGRDRSSQATDAQQEAFDALDQAQELEAEERREDA